MEMILQPFSEGSLGKLLQEALRGEIGLYSSFQAAVAFAKRSGVRHIVDELRGFAERGGYVRVVIGVDQKGTSAEGLSDLLAAVGDGGEIWINHDERRDISFHPKVYLFESETSALLAIGSGNLTQGGLYTNDEAMSVHVLDPRVVNDKTVLNQIQATLDDWCDEEQETVHRLDAEFLQSLVEESYVEYEAQSWRQDDAEEVRKSLLRGDELGDALTRKPLFGCGVRRHRPPRQATEPTKRPYTAEVIDQPKQLPRAQVSVGDWFAITVLHGDLPQPGSSNEIRITKGIRDENKVFWRWPDAFDGPDEKTGQYHRDIYIRFQGQIVRGYLKDFPPQKPDGTKASADFRLGSVAPIVQSLREEDDMVILETTNEENVDFLARVVPKADQRVYEDLADGLIQYTRARSPITGTYKKYKYVCITD